MLIYTNIRNYFELHKVQSSVRGGTLSNRRRSSAPWPRLDFWPAAGVSSNLAPAKASCCTTFAWRWRKEVPPRLWWQPQQTMLTTRRRGGGASTPQVKLSLARAAIDAVAALVKEQPGTSPVEAAAHALDFVAGKEPAAAASGDGEPQPQLQTDYLAVDRTNTRRNFDRFHVQNELSRLERVVIDIEHLVLSKVPLIQSGTKPLVVVGKHLCGAATDLSLVCSMDEGGAAGHEPAAAVLDGGGGGGGGSSGDAAHPVEGMVIALCCHQVCEWHRYCNPSFFSDVLKFSATDFKHIALMSSWAVCGERGGGHKHASSVQRAAAAAASVSAPDEHAAGDFDQSVAASRKREPLRNRESARGH